MRNLKIAIVGNSIGLRVRPPVKYPENKNYGEILEELLQEKYPEQVIWVRNLCTGRATIWDILEKRNEILNIFPHYYVINLGVSDASTREIPLWYSNIIINRKESFIRRVFAGFYFFVIRRFRSFLVSLRRQKTWTSKRDFKTYTDKLIFLLNKDTNARIIIISINPAGMRIEKELPGSRNNYTEFNKILKGIADKYGALYLDTTRLSTEKHIPDGIHFSLDGNQVIAKKLLGLIIREELQKKDKPKSYCE